MIKQLPIMSSKTPTAPLLDLDNPNVKKINNVVYERRSFSLELNFKINNCPSMKDGFHILKKICCLIIIELIYRWPVSDKTVHALMSQLYCNILASPFIRFNKTKSTFHLSSSFKTLSRLTLFPITCPLFDGVINRQFYIQGSGSPSEIIYHVTGTIQPIPLNQLEFSLESGYSAIENYDPSKVQKTCHKLLSDINDSPIFDFQNLLKNVDLGFSLSLTSSLKSDPLSSWFTASSSEPTIRKHDNSTSFSPKNIYKKGKKLK